MSLGTVAEPVTLLLLGVLLATVGILARRISSRRVALHAREEQGDVSSAEIALREGDA